MIGSFRSSLRSNDYSAATIKRKVAALSALFQYLLEKGTVATNPTEGVAQPGIQQQPHPLSSQELADLLYVIGEDAKTDSPIALRNSAVVWLLYATGPKISELKGLNVGDVDLERRVVSYESSKGIKRQVPIAKDEAVQAVQSYLAVGGQLELEKDSSGQALFLNMRDGHRITRQGLWAILQSYVKQGRIEGGFDTNTPRDTFAVEQIGQGTTLAGLNQLLGNTYLSSTHHRYKNFF